MIILFTKNAFVEIDLISSNPSFIIVYLFIYWTSIKLLILNRFMTFLCLLVWGTDTILWYLGEWVSLCWDLSGFCEVKWLADGLFSQSVCFLTWAPDSQLPTLRLCAIFLERRVAPPQEGWRPSIFNRFGLPPKLVQLSIKPILFCRHHCRQQRGGQSVLQCLTLFLL